MKINRFWLDSVSHMVLHRAMPQMDTNLIMFRLGKTLGMIK